MSAIYDNNGGFQSHPDTKEQIQKTNYISGGRLCDQTVVKERRVAQAPTCQDAVLVRGQWGQDAQKGHMFRISIVEGPYHFGHKEMHTVAFLKLIFQAMLDLGILHRQ